MKNNKASGLLVLVLLLAAWTATVATPGCKKPKASDASQAASTPAFRLYLLTDVAGALEPCGCSKDQLGGLDHLAAFIQAQKSKVPASLVLGAGSMLFIDPHKKVEKVSTQDTYKAETLADTFAGLQLAAWAPGYNDYSAGTSALAGYVKRAKSQLLGVGLGGAKAGSVFTVGKTKVGVVGVSVPTNRSGQGPKGVKLPELSKTVALVKKQVAALEKRGATLFVALAAMQRGAALRLADGVPKLNVLVIGQPHSAGHANTQQPPPELIGNTLVVQTANHAQSVVAVDVYLADFKGRLSDGSGLKRAAKLSELSRRIRSLEQRINSWEKGSSVAASDLAARKADLKKLRAERTALEKKLPPAPKGSFFRYASHDVRDKLGSDQSVAGMMKAYYKRVNAHNKVALADLKPLPAGANEASYVGIDSCEDCHMEEVAFFNKTAHAHAYKTLVDDHKEFNLECVGCHVTGYGRNGGSTVTHNKKLQNVQCEVCHGPGSKHIKDTANKDYIILKPDPRSCVEACHHPPHVEGFDAKAKMKLVIGPGHGEES